MEKDGQKFRPIFGKELYLDFGRFTFFSDLERKILNVGDMEIKLLALSLKDMEGMLKTFRPEAIRQLVEIANFIVSEEDLEEIYLLASRLEDKSCMFTETNV